MISHRGISVITPLPFGEGTGEGPLSLWAFVCSVLLCTSVRGRIVLYKRKNATSVRKRIVLREKKNV